MSELLQFVNFKDLTVWSASNYLSINNINTKYALVKISELLKQVKNQEILEDETNYKLSGIHSYGRGLFHRNIKLGKDIKSKTLNKLKTNQFVYSRLGSHTGSFDIVDNKLNNYYVSNEVPTFEFKNKNINPYFVKLIFLLKQYWQDIEKSLQGTAHKRFKEKDFLNLKIPLPPLETQKIIVKRYQDKLNLAKQQNQQAQQIKAEIETYLYKELGIELPKEEQSKNALQFVNFKGLDRWDVAYLLNKNKIITDYDIITVSDIIDKFLKDKNNNSLRFNSQNYPSKKFQYIGMENIEKESGVLLEFQNVKGAEIKSQTIRLPKSFFLYGKLRPYLNKYFYNTFNGENIIISSEFFVFSVKNIDKLYFEFCLSSSFFQYQIINYTKGARMPRIGEDVFKKIQIPLPPPEIQNKIAKHIQGLKDEIQTLKQQAEENKKLALSEFEAEIFNVP
ncbi:Type I restriction-modification system, specificity subunit S [uncultured Gammaproteobacteria bacterium]|jgi:restriction endonuclease S subunit|nr:Type I restriction-modification system, specificity subunit S [uncultured Gammaproteobacteria bacterium]CAC9558183.1 Type I restriction-modification system, specificity subunit S [uncultured Gammaproteobacteria bacterium]CAC9562740.1 Type I restriction-modification system, specificity subunit S [uncultured Gammaproteobacteria bacterium]CAC9566809.1 Type I restriction-modification system, specificity subunit S [uncultured Gammaproteobacteria bacterium]CAC9574375.1 Type I restriction-modificat